MHIPGLLRDIEINLQPLFPTGMIKLVAATPTPSFLTFTDRGDLLFLEGGFIKISGVHHKHVKHTTQAPNYGSILLAQHQDAVYAASFENNNIVCYIYSYDLSECHEFCRFRCDYSGTASLAVTDDYLLVMDRTSYTQSVRVYTHDGKHVRTFLTHQMVSGLSLGMKSWSKRTATWQSTPSPRPMLHRYGELSTRVTPAQT